MAVKENQKELYQDIESAFIIPSFDKSKIFVTEEFNGSRFEKRTCSVIDDLSHSLSPNKWFSLQTIIKIDSERFIK